MTAPELVAIYREREVGRVVRRRDGRCSFRYAEDWRHARGAFPLSLSMPLAAAEHDPRVVDAYLWGLLPDNDVILQRWAKTFHVSPSNAFGLMSHVGSDCAGAVRFVADEVRQPENVTEIEWLSERDIAIRLRDLGQDIAAWRRASDEGQFSLAGAQPKTALLRDGERWGLPSGRTPTTHIIKPDIADRAGHAHNEHFCMSLARAAGLPVARSSVMRFEDQVAIVVERYDRQRTDEGIVRLHQEDLCQALGVHPTRKYQAEGGPTPRDIALLLRQHSHRAIDDVATFVDALAFSWLIAGTDAHAKNYSLLIGSAGRVRLAPLYDQASLLPYRDYNPHKTKLAMKIGGKYRLRDIGRHEWDKLAGELGLDAAHVRGRVRAMAEALPAQAVGAWQRSRGAGLTHPILDQLSHAIGDRAQACARDMS